MDRTLAGLELAWLRQLHHAKESHRAAPSLPPEIAFRLRMRGYVSASAHGTYAITIRGRHALAGHEGVGSGDNIAIAAAARAASTSLPISAQAPQAEPRGSDNPYTPSHPAYKTSPYPAR
jgi:hypothetical protein